HWALCRNALCGCPVHQWSVHLGLDIWSYYRPGRCNDLERTRGKISPRGRYIQFSSYSIRGKGRKINEFFVRVANIYTGSACCGISGNRFRAIPYLYHSFELVGSENGFRWTRYSGVLITVQED